MWITSATAPSGRRRPRRPSRPTSSWSQYSSVVGRARSSRVDDEQLSAQRLGALAVVDALERDQQPAVVLSAGLYDCERSALRRVGVQRAPSANRVSGSSVRTSTLTSPRTPCGRPIRPTTSSIAGVSAPRRCRRRRRGRRARRRRPTTVRSALAVRPVRPMTLPRSSGWTRISSVCRAARVTVHLDIVRVLDDALDQVLEGGLEQPYSPRLGHHRRPLCCLRLRHAASAGSG